MSANDIMLAHGNMLPGDWSFVGIMTGYADGGIDLSANIETPDGIQSMVGGVSRMVAPLVRAALGRPGFAHSVTPLLIFREVA
jgi:hypothetical protein